MAYLSDSGHPEVWGWGNETPPPATPSHPQITFGMKGKNSLISFTILILFNYLLKEINLFWLYTISDQKENTYLCFLEEKK